MSENNDASIDSNCLRGGFTLKASRLGSAVLRLPLLGANSNNSSTSSAGNEKPDDDGIVNNPFLREQKEEDAEASPTVDEAIDKDDEEVDERQDPLTLLRNNVNVERANMFAAAKNTIPRVESSGFVFGQNVHERVVGENISTESNEVETASTSEASSSQLLFSTVIQKAAKSTDNNEAANNNKEAEAKSLTDVAREYEESRAQKRKYEEVETKTGEEHETNVVDVTCKLFAFVNSNWEERGRGSLRLNDAKDSRDCSRVVFRTAGNLRLLLNTKVWAAMVAERASQKSLRLTAMDNTGTVKIFLAMGRPADIAQLHKALSERIAKRKRTHPEECAATGSDEQAKNGTNLDHAADDADVSTSQPESTTKDDTDGDDDVPTQSVKTVDMDETDRNEPSSKKILMMPDSSVDDMHDNANDDDASNAEAEATVNEN